MMRTTILLALLVGSIVPVAHGAPVWDNDTTISQNAVHARYTNTSSLVAGSGTFAQLALSTNDGTSAEGADLIKLTASYATDRPRLSWFDHNGTRVTYLAAHHENRVDGDLHKQFEVKTWNGTGAGNSASGATRLGIGWGAEDVLARFQYLNEFRFVAHNNTPIPLVWREENWTGAEKTLFSIKPFSDASNQTFVDIDAFPEESGRAAQVRWFRNVNTAGARTFSIYRGDGTATTTFTINAANGDITQMGTATATSVNLSDRLTWRSGSSAISTVRATLGGSGESLLLLDATTTDGSKNAQLRIFRETNTTGSRNVVLFRGDGTNSPTFSINAVNGDITQMGNATLSGNASFTTSVPNSNGAIRDVLKLQPTTDASTRQYDRPWLSFFDHAKRQVSMGFHDVDFADQEPHHRFEIKTAQDPALSTTGMVTRFTIDTDKEYARISIPNKGIFTLDNGPQTPGRIDWRTEDETINGTKRLAARMSAVGDASDTSFLYISPFALDQTFDSGEATLSGGTKNAQLRLFRDTNTTGTRLMNVYKGDGSATVTWSLNAGTGDVALTGQVDWATSALGTCDSTATNRGRQAFVEGGAGVADAMYLCVKKADETYAWMKATLT